MSIADLREEYRRESLSERDVAPDPFAQFDRWFAQARAADVHEPNAMALATTDVDGRPSNRMVLLKDADARGFAFFTDYRSRKGSELDRAGARAALCFWWAPLERQVRIEGSIERVSVAESAAYFGKRPRGSRIGAWTSTQSSVLHDREALERRYAELDAKYPGDDVPLPPHWGGYRVVPDGFEFWQGRPSRLHDRLRYVPQPGGWTLERLSP